MYYHMFYNILIIKKTIREDVLKLDKGENKIWIKKRKSWF